MERFMEWFMFFGAYCLGFGIGVDAGADNGKYKWSTHLKVIGLVLCVIAGSGFD
jgi:hypothetical protein